RGLLRNRDRKLPSLWAPDLSRFLKTLGWPDGDGILPNRAYQNQARDAWQNCLDELASLDPVLGGVTRLQAATVLESIAKETSFQIKTREYPIQVMSLPEAYGMQFDRLWILGCHADVLPPPPTPNPFLPLEIQKRFDLPRSTSHRELRWAENILRQLALSSPNVVIGYPAWNAEKELRASPLLKSISSIQGMEEIAQSHRIKDQWRGKREMETWLDPGALPLTPDERQTAQEKGIAGGYQVLKNQADCPFRAFACHRLNATKFETPEIDFDGAERGNIAHYALQRFWSEVKTSAQLRSLNANGELPGVVARCVREAEGRLLSKLGAQKRFAEMERSRLESLLGEWLNKELLRPDFEVVAIERKETIGIAGYNFNLRIDRVDETPHGHKILIDYKTGQIKPNGWLDDRLQEPQLPLYALKLSPDAIAFAEVKKGQKGMGFKFLAKEVHVLPGTSIDFKKNKEIDCPDWDSLLQRWNKQLTGLAEDFAAGKCAADPANANTTCKNCGLQTLCRIEEMKPASGDGGEKEEP
ncbi:MAG: PD-(D/E)XK nuclease family protein, partial [Nitrospinae bacterium]|nr:PD-(D/E)XK nuclease family protein [Nitrospinota bacterium]